MNNLSWFLYFAEIVPALSVLLDAIAFFVIGVVLIVFLVTVLFGSEEYSDNEETKRLKKENKKYIFGSFWKWPAILAFSLLLISSLIPSKQTIYLIAGSEAGEAVATSDEGRELLSDIKTIMKQQIKEAKGDQ